MVAETLQVQGDEEVEEWVLRAIQTGLMEAKMDQMQRVVVIRRCTNRVFGDVQWKVTRDRDGAMPMPAKLAHGLSRGFIQRTADQALCGCRRVLACRQLADNACWPN